MTACRPVRLSVPVAVDFPEPIIDVHRHASWPGDDDAPALAAALAEMDANGIVLTQQLATKLFGNEDPIGKVVKVNNQTDYTIAAVFENVGTES